MLARSPVRRGAIAGLAAGLFMLACMYLFGAVVGIQPLPQLLQQPILAVMPGFVFGFLIDNLQHLGKVVEELGLVATLALALAALGAAYGWGRQRFASTHIALGFAAIGWAVVTVILLPLAGDGFLGLNEGFTAPLVWAVLFAVYGIVLQLCFDNFGVEPMPDADPGRRRLLALVPGGIALAGLGGLALRFVPEWYRAAFAQPGSDLSGPSPEVTPVRDFYVVSKNFSDPVVQSSGWTLNVHGLCDQPQRLALTDLRGLAATTQLVTLECVSNVVGGAQISTGRFTGVRLTDLLASVRPQPAAAAVVFRASDGYTESLPLSQVMAAPEILVAYELDAAPLPTNHGFPARILIPGHYGMKGPKWLTEIEVAGSEVNGYWENQGWDRNAVVKTMSRFDVPRDGSIVRLGPVDLAGIAFAGERGIRSVEWSADGGQSWSPASFDAAQSPYSWVLWKATWTPAREGAYKLQVRAADGAGASQASSSQPSFPNGSSGYHTVQVNVSRS